MGGAVDTLHAELVDRGRVVHAHLGLLRIVPEQQQNLLPNLVDKKLAVSSSFLAEHDKSRS